LQELSINKVLVFCELHLGLEKGIEVYTSSFFATHISLVQKTFQKSLKHLNQQNLPNILNAHVNG
jgi:hypothetical protein